MHKRLHLFVVVSFFRGLRPTTTCSHWTELSLSSPVHPHCNRSCCRLFYFFAFFFLPCFFPQPIFNSPPLHLFSVISAFLLRAPLKKSFISRLHSSRCPSARAGFMVGVSPAISPALPWTGDLQPNTTSGILAWRIACTHIRHGWTVEYKTVSTSRQLRSFLDAFLIARISAWAVASFADSTILCALAIIFPSRTIKEPTGTSPLIKDFFACFIAS